MGLSLLAGATPAQLAAEVTETEFAARMNSGTLAARPAAATYGVGFYYATDDNGGALHRSDGSAWTRIAPRGVEIDYQEITSTPATTSNTASFDDIAGLSSTKTYDGTRPIEILIDLYFVSNSVSANGFNIGVSVDGTDYYVGGVKPVGANNGGRGVHTRLRRPAPSAGSHTIKARFQAVTGGVVTVTAGATQPGSLSIKEL